MQTLARRAISRPVPRVPTEPLDSVRR